MILHRPVDFTTALANNKTLSPLIIITRRQFVLVLLLDHSPKPYTHSRQQSYPERQWPSALEAPIKRPQVAIVFQRCLLQRSISRINDCSPRKMLLSAERFTVARSVLKRFSR